MIRWGTVSDIARKLGHRYAARRAYGAGVGSWEVSWNPRLRTCAGRAFVYPPDVDIQGRIELNPRLRKEGQEALLETFLHELAHLLAPEDKGHGTTWQAVAVELGCSPDPYHDYLSMEATRRVVAVCGGCGHEIVRARRLSRRKLWEHTLCGGTFRHVLHGKIVK